MRRLNLAIAASLTVAFLSACDRTEPRNTVMQPDALVGKASRLVYDFGHVAIDDGPQERTHEFSIVNNTAANLQVEDIKRSCGCLEARVDQTVIPPGQSCTLRMALAVASTGQITHEAVLILSNGEARSFVLTAFGTKTMQLAAFPESGILAGSTLNVRLYLVDSHGQGVSEPAEIDGMPGIALRQDPWITLESREQSGLRPTRQVANAVLDFTQYTGTFPVEVALRISTGDRCAFTICRLSVD